MAKFLIGMVFGVGIWFALGASVSLLRRRSTHKTFSLQEFLSESTRSAQVATAVGVGTLSSVSTGIISGSSALTLLAAVAGGVGGTLALKSHQSSLQKQARLREKLLLPEFLDLTVIAAGAGLGLRSALAAAVERSRPEVSEPWKPLALDVTAQKPLALWLDTLVRADPTAPSSRVASALLIATERGTPITGVLGSLAQELRSESRRELIEIAARKDVQMMLPVVFGILPSVTAVALYPALTTLSALN